MKATAILPVKRFDAAKQRLAAGIDDERRRALVAAMVADVLEAIGASAHDRAHDRRQRRPAGPGARRGVRRRGGPRPRRRRPQRGRAGRDRPRRSRRGRARRPPPRRLPAARPARARPAADRRRPSATSAIVPDRHGDRHQRAGAAAARARSCRPSARAAASATSPPPARPGSRSRSRSSPSLGLDLDTPADVVALTTRARREPRPRQAHRQGSGHMTLRRAVPWYEARTTNRAMSTRGVRSARSPGCRRSARGCALGADDRRPRRARRTATWSSISQKVVSKAEGQVRKLSSVTPGAEARRLAAVLGKEPALVELILERERRGAARRAAAS